jgi:TolB-like protein/Flp pilus assembly protein TadD
METGRWSRIEELFHQAADLTAFEQAAFLDRMCGKDADLRPQLESLLRADADKKQLLEPAVEKAIGELPDAGQDDFALVGKHVGNYLVTGLIGKGGMGTVYHAVREDFRMQVAIKLLKRGTHTEYALSRFRAERQILAELQHPNIARLLDGGATSDGLPYFVMECIDGTPLLEYAARHPVRERVRLFQAVCSAVQYAHENSVVHRDIKPANVLVTADGTPKLLDFGIAKLLDHAVNTANPSPQTEVGVRVMTPNYASPELVRGERVTTASDVYSLGLLLYELLTGVRAQELSGSSPAAIENEICTLQPKRLRMLVKDLDSDLETVVATAIRKEPERRYPSVKEFSADLDRFLRDLPVVARRETRLYRVRKLLKRNRKVLFATAATAVVVLTMVVALGRMMTRSSVSTGELRSIAVLPLQNLSGQADQEYFSDGFTDALINDLARIPELHVISRTSVMSYRNAGRRVPEIARDLGVRTVVEGSVDRAGNRVRVSVRLIDALRDRPVWSGSYEGELRNVLALQNQVVVAVAGEIHVTLTARNQSGSYRDRRVNVDAWLAYLKGRHEYFSGFTLDAMQKAISYFNEALAFDPRFAPAYVGMADCYYGMSNIYYPPTQVMPKAKSAALKALELDDRSAEAHATLALVRSLYDFDRDAAEAGFKRAIELKPSDAPSHLWYGIHLAGLGRFDEALSEVESARHLDPVSPAMNAYIGLPLFLAGRYDQLIERLQPLAEKHPDYHHPYAWLALAYQQKGEWAKAIAAMEKAYKLDGQPEALAQLGHVYAVAGRTAEARRTLSDLNRLSRGRYVSAYNFAVLHAGLGERDEAFRWLQKAEKDRSEWFAAVKVDPRLEALHSDRRFAGVLRSVGLSP